MKHNKRHSTNLWHRFLDHYHHDEQQTQQQQQQQDIKPPVLDTEQEKILATFGPMVRSRFGAGWKRRYLVSFLQDADWNMTQALADMEDCQDANYGLLATPPTTSCSPGGSGRLLGCENDQGTSCYLDALLFAMYIGLTSFDPMLLGDPFEPALSPTPASPVAPLEQQQQAHRYRHRHHRFFSKYHRHHHRHRLLTPFRTSSPPPPPPTPPPTKANNTRQRTLDDLHIKTNPIIINNSSNNNSSSSTSDSNDDDSALQQKHYLQRTLRLFVNKLRKGQLVKTSNVAQVRRALTQNGWYGQDPETHQWQQEDVSELFLFLTSIFDSPYLPFQLRLFHGANKDMDDDRIMTDRLLPLSLPPPPPEGDDHQQEPIRLETILVDQFYNSVVSGVKRKVDLEATSPLLTLEPESDQQLMARSWNSTSSTGSMDSTDKGILEIITTPINEQPSTDPMKKRLSPPPPSTTRATPQRRETEVDAWQAMELLPFYSSSNSGGDDGNLDNYPDTHLVLPLVLKRYKTNPSGNAYVKDTRPVLVPPTIPFHQFVNQNTDNAVCSKCNIKMEYAMSLKSVVTHQGTSPFSGHYVAYTKLLSTDPDQSVWLKFDDLNLQERVVYDIGEAQVLEQVSQHGYLFFYELNRLCPTCLQQSFDRMMDQQQQNEPNTSDSDDSQSDKDDVDKAPTAAATEDNDEQQHQQESSQDKNAPTEEKKDVGDDTNKKTPPATTTAVTTATTTSSFLDKKTAHFPQEPEDWVETVAPSSSSDVATTTATKPAANSTNSSDKCLVM